MFRITYLDAWCDFSVSNGPRRTNGTLKGVAQAKITAGAKNICSAGSSANWQTNVLGGSDEE